MNVGETDVEDMEHIDFLLFGKRKAIARRTIAKLIIVRNTIYT